MTKISTVDKTITPDYLGKTLMHEHIQTGMPGWDTDPMAPKYEIRNVIAQSVDRIEELQSAGFETMVDPCPNDLGRDVELMAEVSARTGFNIVCTTGLYTGELGAAPYWRLRQQMSGDAARYIAEGYIKEITEGVGDTGIKAGMIKLATGFAPLSDYDAILIEAAGHASLATGVPIITHTEAVLGDVQQERLTAMGVPAHRLIVGHSCGSDCFEYHMKIATGGSYLGFDRFGLDMVIPDDTRVASLVKLIDAGAGDRVVVSHDTVWCWLGSFLPMEKLPEMGINTDPLHFTNVIIPKLRKAGVTQEQIDTLLIENPRRYFAGEALPELSEHSHGDAAIGA
jgi:phosphotriesterase-related protein